MQKCCMRLLTALLFVVTIVASIPAVSDPLTLDVSRKVEGLPDEDVDMAVNPQTQSVGLFFSKAGFSKESMLYRFKIGSQQVESVLVEGTVIKGLDPLFLNNSNVLAIATKTGKHKGLLHLWGESAVTTKQVELAGRPYADVDLVQHLNSHVLIPVQANNAKLLHVNPSDGALMETTLKGYLKSGVDLHILENKDIALPTVDRNLMGSYIEVIKPDSGNIDAQINVQGILVADQDLVLEDGFAAIATASFDWMSGFLSLIDFNNKTSSAICLPGVPVPGVDPVYIKSRSMVAVAISNRYGKHDRVAVVDLATRGVRYIDMPEQIRADVDLVLEPEEKYLIAASEYNFARIDLETLVADFFSIDGRSITSTDIRMVENGKKLLFPVQSNEALGMANVAEFEIASGNISYHKLPGMLRPGVDLLPISGQGDVILIGQAANGKESIISDVKVDVASGPTFLIATRNQDTNKTYLSTLENQQITSQALEGILVASVDPWHVDGSSLYLGSDEDFIPNDGVCSIDDSNPDRNSDNPDKRNGDDDPPITWIPGWPPGEITDEGIYKKIGDTPDLEPDEGGTADPYDDVIFAGLRDAQGKLTSKTVLTDPFKGTVKEGPTMSEARTWHLSKTLASGDVLYAGGEDENGRVLKSSELFEPKTNSFRQLPPMQHARKNAVATNLQGCQGTLVTGGKNDNPQGTPEPEAELFIPGHGWGAAGKMQHPRIYHQAVMAPDGAVWIFGGEDENGPVEEVEKYSPETQTFTTVGTLSDGRSNFGLVSFYDGRVALVGGSKPLIHTPEPDDWEPVSTIELWDITEGYGEIAAELPEGLVNPIVYREGESSMYVVGGHNGEIPSSVVRSVDVNTGEVGTVSTIGPTQTRPRLHTRARNKPSDEEEVTDGSRVRPPRERGPAEYTGGGTTGEGTRPPGTTQPPEEPWDGDDPENDSPGPEDAGDPVHLNSGAFYIREVDYSLTGRGGMDLALTRTYNSQMSFLGMFGHGWDHSYNERLVPKADLGMEIHTGSGAAALYKKNPDGTYDSPPGAYNMLYAQNNGTFVLRESNGNKKIFGEDGRLLELLDRNKNSIKLEYNQQGRLIKVLDPYYRALNFYYNDEGLIERLEDFGGRYVLYEYNDSQELVAVTTHAVTNTPNGNDFPDGKTTRYTYSCNSKHPELNHNLLTITRPNEVASGGEPHIVNYYGEEKGRPDFDRIVKQKYGGTNRTGIKAGGEIVYKYERLNQNGDPLDLNVVRNRTTVIDRNGNESIYDHNSRGAEILVVNKAGSHRPIDDSLPPKLGTDPSQLSVHKEYNSLGQMVKLTQGRRNGYTEYVYDASNPDPLQRGNILRRALIADARGGKNEITEFTYEPVYNQVLSITAPLGNDPTYQPRIGTWRKERYVTRYVFDYQEGDSLPALAKETGRSEQELQQLLSAAGVSLNQGDVNEDGTTNQIAGNIIQHHKPSVVLPDWSEQKAVENGDQQKIIITYVQNDFGQVVRETDPAGNLTLYEYYPLNDPDGDMAVTILPSSVAALPTGGYLKKIIHDAGTTPGRQTSVPPRKIEKAFEYNRFGYRTKVVDARGNASRFIYNERGQIVRSITPEPYDYKVDYYFDANDNLIKMNVENIRPDHDGVDQLVTDNPWLSTTYDYDILDQMVVIEEETTTAVIPGASSVTETFRKTEFRYDANGNQTVVILPDGTQNVREYDAFDRVFKSISAKGQPEESVETIHYDENGNIILKIDAYDHGQTNPEWGGDPTFNHYDGNGRLIGTVDALGNVVRTEYDAAGRVVKRSLYDGQDGRNPDLKFENHNGLLISETINYYDEADRLFEKEDLLFEPGQSSIPKKVTTRKEYNRVDLVTRAIDADGESLRYVYDGMHALVSTVDEVGNREDFKYDPSNNLLSVTTTDIPDAGFGSPVIRTSYSVYDELNRRRRVTNPIGETNYFRYDSRGNLIWQTDSAAPKHDDPLGIVPMRINKPGNETVFYVDSLGRQVRKEIALRENGQGNGAMLTPASNPDGRVAETRTYNDRDFLISVTDDPDGAGAGSTTTFDYDALGRLVHEVRADGTKTTVSWDPDGLQTKSEDANGSVFQYTYDDLGRRITVDVSRGPRIVGTTRQEFSYNGQGLLVRTFDNNDPQTIEDDYTVTYEYDTLGRLLRETQNGIRVGVDLDAEGVTQSMTYHDGAKIAYVFDKIDRVRKAEWSSSPTAAPVTIAEYNYVERDKVAQIQHGNQTLLNNNYDDAGRLDKLTYAVAGQNDFYDVSYIYNNRSKRAATIYHHDGARGDVYNYDSVGRLSAVTYKVENPIAEALTANSGGAYQAKTKFELDGQGSQLSVDDMIAGQTSTDIHIVNLMNEYEEFDGQVIRYNDDGLPNGNATNDYYYDAFQRLVRVIRKADNTTLAEYGYDARNRRVFTKYDATNGLGEHLQQIYWAGMLMEEWRIDDPASPVLVARYPTNYFQEVRDDMDVNGNANFEEMLRYYVARDILGSSVAATDENGVVLERYDYKVYGLPTIANADGSQQFSFSRIRNRSLFTGYRYEAETGLYYAMSRDYDPVLRRFVQRDPIGFAGGTLNLYEYASSDPVNYVDPLGTSTRVIHGAYGGLQYLAGTDHPQISQVASALAQIMAEKGKQLWRQYQNNPQVYQEKMDLLEDHFHKLAVSLANRYNLHVAEHNASVRNSSGISFDWDRFKEYWEPLATGASFLPVVGDIFDTIGLAVGFDLTTLEWLTPAERALMAAGLVIGSGAALVKASRFAKKAIRGADRARDAGRVAGNTPTCGRVCRPGSDKCFIAGTLIAVYKRISEGAREDGVTTEANFYEVDLKPIEEIKVGDYVLAQDEKTGVLAYKRVEKLFTRTGQIIYLDIADHDEQVHRFGVTLDHPFYNGTEWIDAMDLKIGDNITTASGKPAVVKAINTTGKEHTVYNFEVEDLHNYFVGEVGILAHNPSFYDASDIRNHTDEFDQEFLNLREPRQFEGDYLNNPMDSADYTRSQRRRILGEGEPCDFCGEPNPTNLDHMVPRSRGGSGADANLRGRCNRCNQGVKGDKMDDEVSYPLDAEDYISADQNAIGTHRGVATDRGFNLGDYNWGDPDYMPDGYGK